MLTREAFNALLKTLEEPPANVVFVLATTEPHKIPETIISRCQRFDFRRPQVHDIARLLARIVESENQRPDDERGGPPVEIQEAALLEIARHSQGGFRDAIGTLEKLITYGEGAIHPGDVLEALGVTRTDLLFEVTDICIERRTAESLQFVQRLANEGVDYPQFIRDLLRHLRQVFLLQHLEDAADDEAALRALGQTVELDDELVRRLLPQANQLHPREVVGMIETLGQAQRDIKDGLDARLQLELALVKITRPQVDASAAGLEERLRRLETGLGATRFACESAGAKAEAAGAKAESAAVAAAAGAPAAAGGAAPAETAADAAEPAAPESAEPDGSSAAETVADEQGGTPPASATAPAADPEITLDRVRRAWELVLQRVQTGSVALYAVLRDARPSALDGDRLTVAMPSNFALTQGARTRQRRRARGGLRRDARAPSARRVRAAEPAGDDPGEAGAAPAAPPRLHPDDQPDEADARRRGARRAVSRRRGSPDRPKETRAAMNPQYQKMMKQVQEMQRKMAEAQEELANETVEASAGGGMVTVVMSGSLEIREVRIQPEAVDPDDVEMLQDLVMAAANEALRAPRTSRSASWAAPPAASTCPTSPACSEASRAASRLPARSLTDEWSGYAPAYRVV